MLARRHRLFIASLFVCLGLSLADSPSAEAQIISSGPLGTQGDSTAKLYERLVNRLHATTQPQQDYLQEITKRVNQRKLDLRLVVAVERYAIRRDPHYPFPFFERALMYEAKKRGITLPSIKLFQDQPIVTVPTY
jgi:hypothetical protein